MEKDGKGQEEQKTITMPYDEYLQFEADRKKFKEDKAQYESGLVSVCTMKGFGYTSFNARSTTFTSKDDAIEKALNETAKNNICDNEHIRKKERSDVIQRFLHMSTREFKKWKRNTETSHRRYGIMGYDWRDYA